MKKLIKILLCRHNWEWMGNTIEDQNPMRVRFQSNYICTKCQVKGYCNSKTNSNVLTKINL